MSNPPVVAGTGRRADDEPSSFGALLEEAARVSSVQLDPARPTSLHCRDLVAERFEVEAVAGVGGMGTVYRARDRASGETVALKLLHAEALGQLRRFEREARILAELRHPGIVRYIAHGSAGGQPYLVMQWLEGCNLADRLREGPLAEGDAVELLSRVCEALAAAHAQGVVHRDIKPSNLFLVGGRLQEPKLLDFGIARHGSAAAATTRTGLVMGTPGYMAPEQLRGERDIDARVDVFSLGCVLHECLTGRPAFAGLHAMAVAAAVLLDEAPTLGSVLGGGCTCAQSHWPADSGPFDSGLDAGADVDSGPLIRSCLEALEAPNGAACEPWASEACRVSDLCCRASAGCFDGVTYVYVDDGLCLAEPARATDCTAPAGEARVSGRTPHGFVELDYAYGSRNQDVCGGELAVVFSDDPRLSRCDQPRLSVSIPRSDPAPIGRQTLLAQLVVDGRVERAEAQVEVTDEGPETLAGTLRIEAPGWDVAGSFVVRECAAIARACDQQGVPRAARARERRVPSAAPGPRPVPPGRALARHPPTRWRGSRSAARLWTNAPPE